MPVNAWRRTSNSFTACSLAAARFARCDPQFLGSPGRGLNFSDCEDLRIFAPHGFECSLQKASVGRGFGCPNLPMRGDEEFAHLLCPPDLGGVFTDFA